MSNKKIRNTVVFLLSAFAWFWTAYECDTIGIAVFDSFLKRFPFQPYVMAAVLTYLTYIWMRPYLFTRSIAALLMLAPAELFKIIRPNLPESGFAPIQVFSALLYVGAAIGMYAMFYPWNIEKIVLKVKEIATRRG